MTCREKMMIEHPDDVENFWLGGVAGCPDDVGYLPKPEGCYGYKLDGTKCTKCWDREIPEENPVKSGFWIVCYVPEGHETYVTCSACGDRQLHQGRVEHSSLPKTCPVCNAMMD